MSKLKEQYVHLEGDALLSPEGQATALAALRNHIEVLSDMLRRPQEIDTLIFAVSMKNEEDLTAGLWGPSDHLYAGTKALYEQVQEKSIATLEPEVQQELGGLWALRDAARRGEIKSNADLTPDQLALVQAAYDKCKANGDIPPNMKAAAKKFGFDT